MNEKIKEIAEFDGWENIPSTDYMVRETKNSRESLHESNLPYLTNLNTLHRVALDVMQKLSLLRESTNVGRLQAIIMRVMFNRPNSKGEYVSLVDAVYDAILYLKNHNQCQPK